MLFFLNTPLHRAPSLRLLIRTCDASIQLPNHFVGLRIVESKLQLDAAVAGVRSVESVLRLSNCCVRPAAACGRPTDHSRRQINKRRQKHRQHTRCSHTVLKSRYTGEQEEKRKFQNHRLIYLAIPHYTIIILNRVHLVTALHRTQRSSPNSSLVHEPSADHDKVRITSVSKASNYITCDKAYASSSPTTLVQGV